MREPSDILVLCYHAVSSTWPIGMAIPPNRLAEQTRWLLDKGYEPATFHDAVVSPPSRKTFSVTFDDGFRSVYEHGFPVLKQLGVPATVFVSTDFMECPDEPPVGPGLVPFLDSEYAPELRCMTWDQARELQDAGWEIASHGVSHPYMTRIDDTELARQMTESKRRCEEVLETPCRTLAYPMGDFDARVVRFAREAGYIAAGTLPDRFERAPSLLEWPRVSVQRDDSLKMFRLKVSPTIRRLRTTPAWVTVNRARKSALKFVRRRPS